MSAELGPKPNGVVGIGWHHATAGTISAAYDYDANLLMLVQHDAFGFDVLASVSTAGIAVVGIGLYPGWSAYVTGGLSGGRAEVFASASVVLEANSHFMMYGAEGQGGPAQLEWVAASTLPEPGTWIALIGGLVLLSFRRRVSRQATGLPARSSNFK
jgi:hypothetical protein